MSYHTKAHNVHCFSCGTTYDLFDLIGMDYGLTGFAEQRDKVCALFAPELDRPGRKREQEPYISVNMGKEIKDRSGELQKIREMADGSCDYFIGRGVTTESCEKHGLFQQGGYAYFPVMEGGICAGWCTRAVDEAALSRYRNSAGPLGLWNGDLIRQSGRGEELFVTEGIIDAILLEQLGKSAVSLCGSQNTGKLLLRCEQNLQTANTWSFVVCGDPDPAGGKMNVRLLEGLERLGLRGRVLPLEADDGDIAVLYSKDREKLLERLAGASESIADASYEDTSAAAQLDDFFDTTRRGTKQEAVSTGFAGLDRLLDGGVYPGLYIVGAVSSLGKTSLVLQMADAIAGDGRDVLFFTLEQSRNELMSKSLSRVSAQLEGEPYRQAFTSRQLLSGQLGESERRRQLLRDTRNAYREAASRLFLREGMADIGTEEIRVAVREHGNRRGAVPVVVVDYLQILRPAEARASDKQNTDRAVVELKRLSRDFNTPVLAVSSFNRENYRAAVSMEAFKESGAIEYSSDVLIGLQLVGAGSKEFNYNAEKVKEPRQLELVILKNRNGIPYAKLRLQYYAKFNRFVEAAPRKKPLIP